MIQHEKAKVMIQRRCFVRREKVWQEQGRVMIGRRWHSGSLGIKTIRLVAIE